MFLTDLGKNRMTTCENNSLKTLDSIYLIFFPMLMFYMLTRDRVSVKGLIEV